MSVHKNRSPLVNLPIMENKVSIEKLSNLNMENKVFIPNLKKIEKILRFSARINLEEGLKKIIKN